MPLKYSQTNARESPVKSTGIIQRVKGRKVGYNVEREPRFSCSIVVGHVIVNRVRDKEWHPSGCAQKNLCFSSDAFSHEPSMLRRWAWILHLFIVNRGNGLELAYNRGLRILLPRISLGCKLLAVTYQEYECAVCLVIVSLCNRTAAERIRQNSVVCYKRDRAITCVFCQDLHFTLMFSALVQKNLFKGM